MYAHLCTWDHLLVAYRKAAKGKRGHPTVAAFEHRLEASLVTLHEHLSAGCYRPGGYTHFYIHEPKRRRISAAPFRDRVVHHALCSLIEPVFERLFLAESYANRVGKGTHRALNHCQHLARRFPYVLQCDLRQFFASVDHAILRRSLASKIDDVRVMHLVDLILQSGADALTETYEMVYFPGDNLFAVLRPRGLPIGNLTSQFWANVYLNPFDHFVKRELGCRGYVRYVDDFMLFGTSKRQLHAWKRAIIDRLATRRLTLHPGAHPRPVTEGLPFLGFVVYTDHRRVKRRKVVHYRRRLRVLAQADAPETLQASIQGWQNHVRYGNTVGLQKAVLGPWYTP